MNWTGGRLQRHSGPAKGHGELTQRQKLHFAKARTQLYNSQHHPPTPFKPQFFASALSNLTGPDYANAPHIQRSAEPLRTLDRHAAAPAVAHRRSPAKQPVPKPDHRHMSRAEGAAHLHGHDSRFMDQRPAEKRSRLENHPQAQTAGVDALRTSRRRAPSSDDRPDVLGNMDDEDTSTRLKAEKTRLLASRDWVGLASSRPFHMAFATGNERQDIGKRRKVRRERKSRHVKREKYHATVPTRPQHIHDDGPYMSGAILADDDIRIRIGTDALATQSFVGENDLHEVNSSAAPSDEMLFDTETRMVSTRPQEEEFREHNVNLRSSSFERANTQNAANHCEADHVPYRSTRLIDRDTPLADVDRLLQQLEKKPSCFPMPHESRSGGAAHVDANVHASLDELEKDHYAKYPEMQEDNVTMQSPASEASGDYRSAYQTHGQGAMDPVTIRSTLSPLPVHFAGRSTTGDLNPEDPKAISRNEGNEIRSRSSTAQPALHKVDVNDETMHLLDDTAWRKLIHVKSDAPDRSLYMHHADDGSPGARGNSSGSRTRNGDESYHVHSGAMRMRVDSAEQLISDSYSMRSGKLEQDGHPTVRNAEAPDGTCSSNLHRQISVSGAVAAAAQTGFQAAPSYQTDGIAKNATPRREKISDTEADAAEPDAAESIWKRFVLGSDESEAQYEERRSPEKALRSTLASIEPAKCGMSSSLFVQRSISSAFGSSPPQPLVGNSHDIVFQRHKRVEAAAARTMLEDGTDELPMSMVVEGARKTTYDGLSSNDWPHTLDDADVPGYSVTSDVEFQSNVAVASTTGQLAGVDRGHGKKMTLSKPKPFGSSAATTASEYRPAGQDVSSTGTAFLIGPWRPKRKRIRSLSRYARSFKKQAETEMVDD
ncbi:hypothetical protein IWZ00DRAFT_312613 [Phyllosticta capitalensis]